jgi:hypothetical protein
VEGGGMTEGVDWIERAGAKAKGKRPHYFEDPAIDRTLSILMAVVGEVSVLRERMDTIERLLDTKGAISRADIETYEPDRDAARERGLITRAYVARVMRGVQQDLEALEAIEPPIEDVSRELKDI